MRAFSTVYPQFWTGNTGKQLRKAGAEAQVVALYLITCHHAHMSGIYYLPKQTIAYETGQTKKSVDSALKALAAVHFAFYDENSEHVWVKEMLAWQVREIKATDNRVIGVVKWCNSLPSLIFINQFYQRYHEFLPGLKPLASPSEGPSKGVQEGLQSPIYPVPVLSPVLDSSSEEGGAGEEGARSRTAKIRFGEHAQVLLTADEHEKLVKQFGEEGAGHRIRDADLYFGSKGNAANYKSHYLTILNWERRNGTRQHDNAGSREKPAGRRFETPYKPKQ